MWRFSAYIRCFDVAEPKEAKMDGQFFSFSFFVAVLLLRIPKEQCAEIIGGNESRPHGHPYMAAITVEGGKIEPYCGGTLIKPNWVLTAAHCFEKKKTVVILGTNSPAKSEPSKQTLRVAQQIQYPCYDKDSWNSDLMLMKLSAPAKINKDVKAVILSKTSADVKAGKQCLVAGWGITQNKVKKSSETLREVKVTIIDRKICNDKKHYDYNPLITTNMICAGDPKGGKDSCLGDSGGPLMCNGEQKGIVSFGKPKKCGDPKYPGVYTRLTKRHLDWIKNVTKGDL